MTDVYRQKLKSILFFSSQLCDHKLVVCARIMEEDRVLTLYKYDHRMTFGRARKCVIKQDPFLLGFAFGITTTCDAVLCSQLEKCCCYLSKRVPVQSLKLLSRPKVSKSHRVIPQELILYNVRTLSPSVNQVRRVGSETLLASQKGRVRKRNSTLLTQRLSVWKLPMGTSDTEFHRLSRKHPAVLRSIPLGVPTVHF